MTRQLFEISNLGHSNLFDIGLPARPIYARRSGGFAQAGAASAKQVLGTCAYLENMPSASRTPFRAHKATSI